MKIKIKNQKKTNNKFNKMKQKKSNKVTGKIIRLTMNKIQIMKNNVIN